MLNLSNREKLLQLLVDLSEHLELSRKQTIINKKNLR